MAEAKLYGQNKGGMSINGIIKDYYAYAGENISAGDLVEYVNGIAGKTNYGTSTDTQINTESYTGNSMAAVELDNNRVFIAHGKGQTAPYLYGIVCTIDGANITCGADTQLNSTTGCGTYISTCLLPNGNVFIAHSYGTGGYAAATIISAEGTTIKKESFKTITSSRVYNLGVCTLSNGNVFYVYESSGNLVGVVCTIAADNTITTGSQLGFAKGNKYSMCALSNGNVFVGHSSGNYYQLYGMVVSINGTTITAGTDTSLTSTLYTGQSISARLLPNGNVFIAHSNSNSYYLNALVCTINGTTITAGTDVVLENTNSYVYQPQSISACVLSNEKAVVFYTSNKSNYYMYAITVSINGTTVVKETDTALNNNVYSGYKLDATLMQNGTIFAAHCIGSAYLLNAQIFGIDEVNNVPTNHIIATEYETQVRQVTTGQFDGIAKTSGTGGDDTGHKDIVSIWTMPVYVEVIKQGNIIPIEWVEENLYQYRADGVTLIAATINSDTESAGLYKAYLACDNDTDTYYRGNEESVARYEWLQWEFDEPRKITKMQVRFRGLNNIATDHVSITIQGSNNSNEWADLFSIPLPSSRGYESEITLSNVDYYKYYRIYSRNKQGYLEVHDWYVTEYAVLEEK